MNVDLQLEKVRAPEFLQASSARMATMADAVPNDWLCAAIGESWVRGAGLTNFASELPDSQIELLIRNAQEEWAKAMVDGRVAVDRWDRGDGGVTLDVPEGLRQEMSKWGENARPLARFVFGQTSNFRKEVTGNVFQWMTSSEAEGEADSCTRERSRRAVESETSWHEARMAMDREATTGRSRTRTARCTCRSTTIGLTRAARS